jgi:diadenosine tetraphosphatase ApaH/serine/threonine PP2A family protein phosphatase
VQLTREHAAICLAGNHDLAVTGGLSLQDFSTAAAAAARWTRRHIAADNVRYLDGLAPEGAEGEVGLFHASPRDPVWEYVVSALLADECLDAQPQRLSLVGHSHIALSFLRPEGGVAVGRRHTDGDELDLGEGEWLLNPGSVGQPRDGDPRAAWLLLDTDAWRATWRRCDYDVGGAAEAIRAAGLPESLAERLGYGQ